ncbi:TetR/AcrR family transcriptional regulator [Actinoalloteichus caeruleus]|uniref:TetR/AcrR family transcriptional regulator n=1 Tax=Actinoalloteichus cyanogriseus TaxID=2893586 RepID=UPI003AAACB81
MAAKSTNQETFAHGMALLWGTTGDSDRGRRPRLTRERIAETAIGMADAGGLAAVSMRAVATRLGFTAMSLYRHVPSRDDLVDVMVDRAYGELSLFYDLAGGWRARLEARARQDWDFYHRHPWVLEISTHRAVPGPNMLAAHEAALDVLLATGLPEDELVNLAQAVDGYVRGSARLSVEGAGTWEDGWRSAGSPFWRRFDLTNHPSLAKVAAAGASPEPRSAFELGLARLLDGVESLVAAQESQSREALSREALEPGSATGTVVPRNHSRCLSCGAELVLAPTGRRRSYCSRACQQRAYRARRAGGGDRPRPHGRTGSTAP